MSSDSNGTSIVLTKPSKRGALALPIEEEDERVCLDDEAMVKWMIDKSSPHQGKQQCVIFTLTHDHKVNGNKQITSSRAIKKTSSPGEREEIIRHAVEEFDYEAEETVKHYADIQRFVVWAYKTEGSSGEERKDDAEFSRSFSVEPPEGSRMSNTQAYGDPGGGSIDVVALVQTSAKAQHQQNQLCLQNMQQCMERLANQCDGLLGHVQEIMGQRYDNALKLEKSLDDRSRREAEARDQNMKTDAMWMLFQGGFEFAKSFGTRWMAVRERQLGMGGDPEKVDGPFIEFAKTLDPQQLLGIATVLTREQQRMFAPMADKIVYAMPPEKQELAGALFGAWRDSLEAQEQAEKKAASDPGVKVTVTETPKSTDKTTDKTTDKKERSK